MIYSNLNGINQLNREINCILYTSMPRWLFLTYEYFIEFTIVVMLGVFASVLIEAYIKKTKRFFPGNQFTAFVYGAVLPICSCGVVPLIETMKARVPLRVIITFVISAPLLNPYIVVLSLTNFGISYCIMRIVASFLLAYISGIVVEMAARYLKTGDLGSYNACKPGCAATDKDLFIKTLRITLSLMPYILIGGAVSFALELFNPKQMLSTFNFSNHWLSMLVMTVVGIPLYVCNGADILLLKPLLSFTDLSMGSAMVFSLTSSAVCISSIAMLSKFLGKKLTIVLVACISLLSVLIGLLIDMIV